MMTGVELWCEVTCRGADGSVLAACVLEGRGAPDLEAVDDVARLALFASRAGGRVVLTRVAPALRELLDLAGLRVEMEGQAEGGEEPLGIEEIEEEAHLDDLSP